MDYILELNKVSKAYEKSNFFLDQISFALPYGSIMGFVGENGAGKTTTIDCILNTIFKDSGTIKLFGKEMSDSDTELRENIGVVYDGDNLPGYLSAGQIADIMRDLYKNWDDALFQQYLSTFHLNKAQKVKTYSKGMAMKLAMAVALAHRPKLLILDEATSGLDPIMRDEMLDVFLDFVAEADHSILLSSHITDDLERVCDYISFLDKGRLVFSEDRERLRERYGVVRAGQSALAALPKDHILGVKQGSLGMEALVDNRMELTGC